MSPVLGNIIAAGLVLALVFLCARFLWKDAKSGGCAGCSGHCASCHSSGASNCRCSAEQKKPDEGFYAWRAKRHQDERA
ncbi:MAG: FeoB-associated Cys-rich membrane protein [Lachnospiraceae bacterium]|nr:FeoB-associated Cys-rich membrane protein [Lachnospiraceae bacterium]